jgi:hypothetical protein
MICGPKTTYGPKTKILVNPDFISYISIVLMREINQINNNNKERRNECSI